MGSGRGRGHPHGPGRFAGPGPYDGWGVHGPHDQESAFPPGPPFGPDRGQWAWSRIPGLLGASLLLALRDRPAHGYNLLAWVQDHGFAPDGLNAGTLYRVLRRMEEAGLVESEWASEGSGPFRRDYRLTSEGRAALQGWAARLSDLDSAIRKFLDLYGSTQEGK